ncbi:MAG: transcription activator effector binding protein [Bacteroidetes bacterium]|nr:MAG: transcription activator effector binding protein [Bacteroidota bacterium]
MGPFLRFEEAPARELVGLRMSMSFAGNLTPLLWRSFMPRRKEIVNNLNSDLISMQDYGKAMDFRNFDVHARFDKWAVAEVADFTVVPEGMESYVLPAGLYAVFFHKGAASTGEATFRYIFETWMPSSGYVPDNRPHFEVLGAKYRNNDPDSEEEIWIPVKPVNLHGGW